MANEWEELYRAAIIETDGSKWRSVSRRHSSVFMLDFTNFPSITAARLKKTELSPRLRRGNQAQRVKQQK
jgi:hypothetical protein